MNKRESMICIPALALVTEVKETNDLDEVVRVMASGKWIVIAVSSGANGVYLFALGKVA